MSFQMFSCGQTYSYDMSFQMLLGKLEFRFKLFLSVNFSGTSNFSRNFTSCLTLENVIYRLAKKVRHLFLKLSYSLHILKFGCCQFLQ